MSNSTISKHTSPQQDDDDWWHDFGTTLEKALEYCDRRFLWNLPPGLQDNRSCVFALVERRGCRLLFASERLKSDEQVVQAALESDGMALEYASERLQANGDIVKVAVKNNGLALEFASARLREDRDIVEVAVKNDGHAIRYAHTQYRYDADIVRRAVENCGDGIFGDELQQDRAFVLTALRAAPQCDKDLTDLSGIVGGFGNDREVMLEAVRGGWGWTLSSASDDLRADREIALLALQQDGNLLSEVASKLKGDREVVLAAVTEDGSSICWADDELRADVSLVSAAVSDSGPSGIRYFWRHLHSPLQRRVADVVEALKARCYDMAFAANVESVQSFVADRKEDTQQAMIATSHLMEGRTRHLIFEFAGMPAEFSLWRELEYLSPLLGALGQEKVDFDSLVLEVEGVETDEDDEDE